MLKFRLLNDEDISLVEAWFCIINQMAKVGG